MSPHPNIGADSPRCASQQVKEARLRFTNCLFAQDAPVSKLSFVETHEKVTAPTMPDGHNLLCLHIPLLWGGSPSRRKPGPMPKRLDAFRLCLGEQNVAAQEKRRAVEWIPAFAGKVSSQ